MRRTSSYLLPFVCLLAMSAVQAQDHTPQPGDDLPTTLLNTEIANNTSACSAKGTPSYCNEALPNLETSSGNQADGAQTTVVDAFPKHVSTISAHRLMYKNWNGQLICEYQPWFENTGSFNGHIDIGYNENTSSTVQKQDGTMITRGCNINFVDFYGTVDSGQQFNLTTTNNVYTDVSGRANLPLKLGILEDQGSFDAGVAPYCGNQTPALSESATITCIENALESDMTYVYNTYISPKAGVYWMDGGTNVIGYFGACPTFSALTCNRNETDDWDTIWSAVQSYVDSKGYNMKFIFQFGYYGYPTISAGTYAWPQPYSESKDNHAFQDNPPSQYWWCDPTGITCDGTSSGYLDQFYIQSQTPVSDGEVAVGLLYSGFDDSNASWTDGRVIAQQCGQILLDSANEVTAGAYWGTGHQIPYMMIATWNDYEEGTEEESGVDNCYGAVNLSYKSGSTTVMDWSLGINSGTLGYQTIDTIHHYALWTATHGSTSLTLRAQPAYTATSYDLSTLDLPAGTYDVYLEMVGEPSIQNEMSATPLEYTQN
jgi:hypothetical protein